MLKTVSSVINAIGALNYQGTWNANTNTPTLQSGVGTKGDYYVVSQAGSTNLDGITDWQVNDWAIFNGTIWQKIDNTDLVTSVNGQTGAVVLTAPDVGATPNTAFVIAGTGLSGGGQLTGNVTINMANTAVSAGTYGDAAQVSQVTIDNQGRVTNASNVGISIAVANVSGAVPNSVNVLSGGLLSGGGPLTGNVTISLTSVPLANVAGAGTMASQDSNNVNISGGVINVTLVNSAATTGNTATYATDSLPLVPEGFVTINLNGVAKKIPYYGV